MAGFADIKRQMRREVHAAFAVAATYQDSVVVVPKMFAIRWHDKTVATSSALNELTARYDYVAALENIDKVIFSAEELAAKGVTPVRNGLVKLTEFNNYELVLDMREPADGPLKVTWTVKRPSQNTDL